MTEPSVVRMLGKYRIETLLGQGGMGCVYAAFDTVLHRRVAVKVLPIALAQDVNARKRFVLEARAAARLNHPNVVTVHDVARDGEAYFIAMELICGGSVAAQLESSGRLEWRDATRIIADACRGLRAAHAAGLIHRDIKPSNLMLGDDGAAKLADFGLSKAVDYRGHTLTGANDLCGTPMFMSPEQCRCDEVNDLSDIYSLGATYYALLVGQPPYQGEQPVQVMFAHCSGPIPDPRRVLDHLPELCSVVVRRAMAKNPADRFKSAADMLETLESMLTARVVPPPPASQPLKAGLPLRPRRRSPQTAVRAAGWVAVVVACLALVATQIQWRLSAGKSDRFSQLDFATLSPTNAAKGSPATQPKPVLPFRQRVDTKVVPIRVGAPVSAIEMSQDGHWLIVGEAGGEGRFKVIDLDSGQVVQDDATLAFESVEPNGAQRREQTGVWALAMSPTGDQLVLGADGPAHGVWSLRRDSQSKWRVAQRLAPAPVRSLAFSVEGNMLAAAFSATPFQREPIRMWNTVTLLGASPLKSLGSDVTAVAFSGQSGMTFIVGDEEGDITLFHLASKREHTIKTNRGIESLAVSRDQTKLAISGDGRLEIRELNQLSQANLITMVPCRDVDFAADGSRVFTAGSRESESEIGIWAVTDLRSLGVLRGHTQAVNCLAVSLDSKLIASGSDDQSVRLWNIEVQP